MRLRSTPIPLAAAAWPPPLCGGEGGIKTAVPHSGAAVLYLGGTTSPLESSHDLVFRNGQRIGIVAHQHPARVDPDVLVVPCMSTQPDTLAPFSTRTPRKRMEFSTSPSMMQPSATRELIDLASGP